MDKIFWTIMVVIVLFIGWLFFLIMTDRWNISIPERPVDKERRWCEQNGGHLFEGGWGINHCEYPPNK